MANNTLYFNMSSSYTKYVNIIIIIIIVIVIIIIIISSRTSSISISSLRTSRQNLHMVKAFFPTHLSLVFIRAIVWLLRPRGEARHDIISVENRAQALKVETQLPQVVVYSERKDIWEIPTG